MSTMTVTQPTTGLSLCSVTFTSSPLPGGRTIARFEQPGHYLACASPVSGDPLQSVAQPPAAVPGQEQSNSKTQPRAAVPHAEGFLLLTLNPANQAAGAKQAEAWMQAGGSSNNTVLRQSVDGGWVLYCPGRAVICAPENVAQDLQVALADVQFHDGLLRKLEAEIAKDWPLAVDHIPLAHRADLRRSGGLKALTTDTLTRRMTCARIERPLLVPTGPMTDAARKLAVKLRDSLDIEDRLDTLDGQIEVYEDLCEVANQRLSDYSHFFREFIVEILIVLLLAAEVTVALMNYFYTE
jgi:hypothetical protein